MIEAKKRGECRKGLVMRAKWKSLMIFFLLVPAATELIAQEGRPSPKAPPGPEYVGQTEPAPNWVVWRAFYGSLQFYSKQSQEVTTRLLTSRLQIDAVTASNLLRYGEGYIARFEQIENGLRTLDRQERNVVPPAAATDALDALIASLGRPPRLDSEGRSGSPAALLPREFQVSNGRSIAERASSVRRAEFARHQQQLLDLLGEDAFTRLETWVDAEVRPNVRIAATGKKVVKPPAESQVR